MRFLLSFFLLLFPGASIALSSTQSGFLRADYVEYDRDGDFIYATGNVTFVSDEYYMGADFLSYDVKRDEIFARGNVVLKNSEGKKIFGESLFLKDRFKKGLIAGFIIKFEEDVILASRLASRLNEYESELSKSRFSPCPIGCRKNPLWSISAGKTYLDFNNKRIVHKNLFFEIYGIKVFYLPVFAHPTPRAPARSGILRPSVSNQGVKIPFYYRAKPNLDFTLSPRFSKKDTLLELEARLRDFNGFSILKGGYVKSRYVLKDGEKVVKDKKLDRFHIDFSGDFYKEGYSYGFNVKKVSDRAYLKNYYNIYDPYINSRFYFSSFKDEDYFFMEALDFQGLENLPHYNDDPIVFPKIRTKNNFALSDEIDFILSTDNLTYKEENGISLARSSVNKSIKTDFITGDGTLWEFSAKARSDFYRIQESKGSQKETSAVRSIPSFEALLRHPFGRTFGERDFFVGIEPIVSVSLVREKRPFDKKFETIDPSRKEITDYNLFSANKYSGIDYYDFGSKIEYGLQTVTGFGPNYFSAFLGKSSKTKRTEKNRDDNLVGRIGADFGGIFDLFYSFRKTAGWRPILDEIGVGLKKDRLNLRSIFVLFHEIGYYDRYGSYAKNSSFKQSFHEIGYALNERWTAGGDARLDSSGKKVKLISKSIKVTYSGECASISAKVEDYYVSNEKIGVRKTRSKAFSLGLKFIN